MKTFLFCVIYWITFPIRVSALVGLRIYGEFTDPQGYNPGRIQAELNEAQEIIPPFTPTLNYEGYPVAGFPDHCCSRTGELVDCGVVKSEKLTHFVLDSGEITRAPDGVKVGPPVSGDMICGWLLGFTSPNAQMDKDLLQDLTALADWLIANGEGPTERLDCGFRRNPLLVGAQALLPLALYWTAWNYTGEKRFRNRYLFLFFVMGYGILSVVPTAFVHGIPKGITWLSGVINKVFHTKIELPYNPRSLYNDANCMRCLAVLQRQTVGAHRLFFRACAFIVWTGSRHWHLPFMDKWGLGSVRAVTKNYCALLFAKPKAPALDLAPVTAPKWGESWDDERYFCGVGNPQSIGPYFDAYYAGLLDGKDV